jgi:hypothetical protein
MARTIDVASLDYVRYSTSPWKGKKPRVRGKKAAGLRYERRVGEELARRKFDFAHGPWLEFSDGNGRGFAQPDFVIYDSAQRWLILEAKLSQTSAAFEQLFSLYVPLLAHLHEGVELIPVQVCRNLRNRKYPIIEDVSQAKPGCIWHWLH